MLRAATASSTDTWPGHLPSKRDILAMMHFWRYVGHVLGVRPRWYPSTIREAMQLSFVTILKGARTSGEDGIALCQSYAQAFAPKVTATIAPNPAPPLRANAQPILSPQSNHHDSTPATARDRAIALRNRLRAEWEHRVHLGYTRLFTLPPTYRHNRLPTVNPWFILPLMQAPLRATAEMLRRLVPPLEAVADRRARAQRSRWFAQQMGERSAEYRPVERMTR